MSDQIVNPNSIDNLDNVSNINNMDDKPTDMEKLIHMYKQFKSSLMYHCREDNGGSDTDNYFDIVDIVNCSNNIDKFINELEKTKDWTETKYWKSEIYDIDYDTLDCELSKEDITSHHKLKQMQLFDICEECDECDECDDFQISDELIELYMANKNTNTNNNTNNNTSTDKNTSTDNNKKNKLMDACDYQCCNDLNDEFY